MGCGMSSKHHARDAPVLTIMSPETYKDLLLIGLCEREIRAFQRVFYECVMDDVSHATGLDEIMLYYNLNGPLPKRICQYFLHKPDMKKSDRIGIRQFIIHSWWYLSMDKQALAEFSYDIFHVSKHEKGLTYSDLYGMLEVVQSKTIHGTTIHEKIVNLMTIFYPGKSNEEYRDPKFVKSVTISRFEYLSKIQQFSALMYPIFEIQHGMRVKVLGSKHWKALEKNAVLMKKRPDVIKLLASPHQGVEEEALLHRPNVHTLENKEKEVAVAGSHAGIDAARGGGVGTKYQVASRSQTPLDSHPSSGYNSDVDDKGSAVGKRRGSITKPAIEHHYAPSHSHASGHHHVLGTGKNAAFDQHLQPDPTASLASRVAEGRNSPAPASAAEELPPKGVRGKGNMYSATSKPVQMLVSGGRFGPGGLAPVDTKAITELKRVVENQTKGKGKGKGTGKASNSTLHEVSLVSPGGAPYVEGHGAPVAGLGFQTAAAVGSSHHGHGKKSVFF